MLRVLWLVFSMILVTCLLASKTTADEKDKEPASARLSEARIPSTLDDELQPVRYWAPETAKEKPTPLFVYLHSWSGDYRQQNDAWLRQAVKRGWIYLHPDFRGPNNSPKACGSKFARQDILDAMAFADREFTVDASHVYLAGTSGGGHMAMLMAGHHQKRFTAVSAWVGISDLAEWYRFHSPDGKPKRYAQMIARSLGGPPGESRERDVEYRDRSPVFQLHRLGNLPLDIAAGVKDGKTGSVPIMHSLRAFNVIAESNDDKLISEAEIEQLWENGKLDQPMKSDLRQDKTYGREIFLRRYSRNARVTIFDGGHEGLPEAACEWLARHTRSTRGE